MARRDRISGAQELSETRFEYGVTPFYFLRHGETPESQGGIVQGQNESQLNAVGRETAEKAAEALSSVPLGSIYASPLRRAWLTASIVSVLTGAPAYPLPGLMERHWGVYQGRPKEWRPPLSNPRTVETIEDFTRRVLDALRSISGPSPVLVVAHSGVFRVICSLVGLPIDRGISIASGLVLKLEPPTKQRTAWHITVADGG